MAILINEIKIIKNGWANFCDLMRPGDSEIIEEG